MSEQIVNSNRVYLNGFMGSGKSTLGPIVAGRLGWAFSDLDDRIVEVIGMSIGDFFRESGEPAFRELEAERLRATSEQGQLVVAVGGGALCQEENLEWALQNGLVVFLRVSAEELVRRLRSEAVTRPMLLKSDGSMINENWMKLRIGLLLERREKYYSRAHKIVAVGEASVDEVAEEIAEWVVG